MNVVGSFTWAIKPASEAAEPDPEVHRHALLRERGVPARGGVSREISVDWLGQKPALPAPSIATSTNASHGSRTSGSRPNPSACRTSPAARVGRAPTRSISGPARIPATSCANEEHRDDEPGRPEREPADVVQVDDEEREDEPVPERVREAADLEQPDGQRQARVQAPEVVAGHRPKKITDASRK